jgi:hypothetical protein
MSRRFACSFILAGVILTGCAKEETEPYAESIPDIPPGRASTSADDGGAGYQPPAPPAPPAPR